MLFLLAELHCGIHLKANNYLVKSECVIQLLKNKQQQEERKSQGGLMDNVRVNGGQNCKTIQPKRKLEAQSSGRWRWLLPGDSFQPWKSSSVPKNGACALALKGGAGWMALFWGVSSFYVLQNQPWDTEPEITQGTQARPWRFLILTVASSCLFPPARIWHLQGAAAVGLWPISNSWWHFSPSAETFSLRFLLHLINKHSVWHF